MVKDIYCFHVDFGRPDLNDTLLLWKEVWVGHGWTPHVLGMADAQRHPKFQQVADHAARLPTINNRRFSDVNFLRWCAFAQVDGVVADYDVFPRVPFPPLDLPSMFNGDLNGGPGFVYGPIPMVDWILAAQPEPPHICDMVVMARRIREGTVMRDLVRCYGVPGWDQVPLVHFGNGYMKTNLPKAEEIKQVLQL